MANPFKRLFGREPSKKRFAVVGSDKELQETLATLGYTTLDKSPEVVTAVSAIARLVASMSIHLMQNTEDGDVRQVNGLSRLADIEPCHSMTRANFYEWVVRTALLDGGGNAFVLPVTANGYIDELRPMPGAHAVSDNVGGYTVRTPGGREYQPNEVLHFAVNPSYTQPWCGRGYTVLLKDVADNIKQARATETGFLKTKWKPSIIVKVDALTDEFSSPEGRKKLLDSYFETADAGEPWLIPADQFDVQQVKPLTLQDLALADFVELDKKAVAAILGVPAYLLGVGAYDEREWQNFINATVKPLAQNVAQEMTRKLLTSRDLYFRFNPRSLMNYDLKTLADIGDAQYVRGIMTGNEVRDWLGMPPVDGLDQRVLLENYIPADMVGDQKKLNPNGSENGGQDAD